MKLTPEQVFEIFISDELTSLLAVRHGVSTSTVRAIKRRRSHPGVTGQYELIPGRSRSNRYVLDDKTVREIYLASGTPKWFKSKFGVSKRVVSNIKFRQTYLGVTEDLGIPGEIQLYSLTWDDVCTIRASSLHTTELSQMFGVTRETINNIKSGRTRRMK